MTLQNIFRYLDLNMSPDKGGKVQLSIDGGKESIKIFIFNKEINSYSYIFIFTKENIDGINTFSAMIKSGFSGIDYKLGLELNTELYDSIKSAITSTDAIYMKYLQKEMESYKDTVPKEGPLEEIEETTNGVE